MNQHSPESPLPAGTPWTEPSAALRGSVVVLAGRGESAAVYRRFAARLAFDGYRVAVVPDASRDLAESARLAGALLADRDDVPRVIVGSDTGAAATVTLLAEGRLFSEVAVLAGLPAAEPGGSDALPAGEWESELELRSACPVHRGALSAEGAVEPGELGRFDAVAEAVTPELASRILVPVLTVHGSADAVSDPLAASAVYSRIPDVESYLVEGGRHDILNDVSHRSVAATIVLFLERLRAPGRPRVVVPADTAIPVHA
ncbi:lysophospholipase [Herbiconiux moechotypicola]|uniref:Alpha/beta fold hydrolase n=1 Tax=Herbiconiux moechotypicola TaxID=637393 RepID=A0ABN3DQ07_9MICO|nr:lysophospholipase [Herbiconiux moechotypicola]MCS5730350.1 lysophospholipase [Herbiconiux moechotypicola]